MARTVFYAASAAIVLWAGFIVPLPFVEYVPNAPTPIPPLVEVEGIATTDLNGETALLTVLLRQQPTVPSLWALLDDRRALLPLDRVYPPGTDRQEYLTAERERFGRQFDIAAAIGAQAAGIETELVTEVVVVEVIVGSPAHGLLAPGDVVLAVDASPIVAAEELQAITRASDADTVLTLTVEHAGEVRDVAVSPGYFPGSEDQPRLGVAIETAVDELRLPFEVRLTEGTRIGVPSAGMMVAVTVYDLLSEENLLAGRTVVGTGTIDADGRVGPVGGVGEKMRSAAEYGADIVLVPAMQLEVALAGAPQGLRVVGVATIDEALDALRREPV
jgi:Lon-like protease